MKPLLTRTLTDSASRTQTAKRLLTALNFVAALFLLSPSVSYSATQDCTVNFSDSSALNAIVGKAASTFVVPSTLIDGRVAAWAQVSLDRVPPRLTSIVGSIDKAVTPVGSACGIRTTGTFT